MSGQRCSAARVVMVVALAWLGGCAKPGLYHWGNYEDSLHKLYRNPASRASYFAELGEIIRTADEKGLRVPPGLCAEYGYLHYLNGDIDGAVVYWQREKDDWPEAVVLMDTLIANARAQEEGEADGEESADAVLWTEPEPAMSEVVQEDSFEGSGEIVEMLQENPPMELEGEPETEVLP